jgi:hypothetical protein
MLDFLSYRPFLETGIESSQKNINEKTIKFVPCFRSTPIPLATTGGTVSASEKNLQNMSGQMSPMCYVEILGQDQKDLESNIGLVVFVLGSGMLDH